MHKSVCTNVDLSAAGLLYDVHPWVGKQATVLSYILNYHIFPFFLFFVGMYLTWFVHEK